ncbi:MAG: site-specific DNA-methyltransferase [Candidatus Aenigmarchaeota archaeon]|nr:site-specific DNA-methyltransferase [Candidatus Aenigmarchaeota archaeon]
MKTEHKCIVGDSLEIMKKMSSESIDLIITDPPFNIGKDYGGVYKDKKKFDEYIEWCKLWLTECMRLLKKDGSLYLFNYPENNAYILPFLQKHMVFKRWMTWHYPTNTGHSKSNFTRTQHSILFFAKTKNNKFNRKDVAEPYKNPNDRRIQERLKNGSNGRTPYDVFQFNLVKNVSKDKTPHPCQIPVSLLKIFIKASSNEGDTVLDPFAGSFSTCVASKELNRNSIGIDINPKYVDIGKQRLSKIKPLEVFV